MFGTDNFDFSMMEDLEDNFRLDFGRKQSANLFGFMNENWERESQCLIESQNNIFIYKEQSIEMKLYTSQQIIFAEGDFEEIVPEISAQQEMMNVENTSDQKGVSTQQTLAETESRDKQESQESAQPMKREFFKIKRGKAASSVAPQSQIKNECRYITTVVISSLKKEEYYEKILEFASNDQDIAEQTIVSFTQQKQSISGFQTLKDCLTLNSSDDEDSAAVKNCFRKFMIWFLENRYLRYILSKGKMDHAQKYITYKNNVMLKNLKNPIFWSSNRTPSLIKKKIKKQ